MNDLAEKALQGLQVTVRGLRARPMRSFAALGFVLSAAVVVSGSRVNAARPARPLTTWFGLQNARETTPGDAAVPATIMVAGIVALILAWIVVTEFVRRTGQPSRRVWPVAGAWALPFALGPPLMETTTYSYAAFGLLQRHGLSTYSFGPSRLGDLPVVSAIEPASRATPSGVGPLGTLLQHLAISVAAGDALACVIVWRVFAVLVVVALGRLVAELGGRSGRGYALALAALNPLVLLYVLSATHLDGLLMAFVLAAVLAARRHRWLPAVVFTSLAGSVSAVGFVALPAILALHCADRRSSSYARVLVQDLLAAAVTVAVLAVAASDGSGWPDAVREQFAVHTPFSVAGGTSKLLGLVVQIASVDNLVDGARAAALIAMACALGYLWATLRRRPLILTVGYALVAVALFAPVLHPWYLLWPALCLAPAAAVRAGHAHRVTVLALCAAACLLTPPGYSELTTNLVTGAALVLVAAVTMLVLARGREDGSTGDLADRRTYVGQIHA